MRSSTVSPSRERTTDASPSGYEMRQPKFERVRRITGYLVGTTDRWNNAKQAEEHERVKHGLH